MQKFTHYFFNVFFTGFCCAYLIFILENMTWRGLSKKTFLTLLLPLELLLTMIPGTLLLKSVLSEIRVRTWVQKNRTLDWLTSYLVYQLKAYFFAGKPLELMSLLGSQKKLNNMYMLLNYYHFSKSYFQI